MSKWYPRSYLVVRDGEVESVTAKDAGHEAAIILKHSEAVGTNRPETFDDRSLRIPDAKPERE